MTMNSNQLVLIIGAGLAGLSLAQGLKLKNVPFRIFERDPDSSFRAQGYRIRISPEGAKALKTLLPTHLWHAFESSCAPVVRGGQHVDAVSGQITEWESMPGGGPPIGSAGTHFNADRVVLRKLLLSGLEEDVVYGKHFMIYEILDDGLVELHFKDGTSYKGHAIVGADGSKSAVRKQLLPNFTMLDTEGRAIFGKTNITTDIFSQVPKELGHGISLIGESQQAHKKLFCDSMVFDRSNTDQMATLGLELPKDYIYWVLVFRIDELSGDEQHSLHGLSPEESASKAEELTSVWHPSLRALFANQERSSASTLAFHTSPPSYFAAPWEIANAAGRITLLGDAAHAMPPVGGVGANTAFQDAEDLCRALYSVFESTGKDVSTRFLDYENEMRLRARSAVERSVLGGGRFFGMRPIEELKPSVW